MQPEQLRTSILLWTEEEIRLEERVPTYQTLALSKSHHAPKDSKVVVDCCWLYTFGQPRIFVLVNTVSRDFRQLRSGECGFQFPDGRPISLASIRVHHSCEKLVGPLRERRWSRFRQMKTPFEYFSLPS